MATIANVYTLTNVKGFNGMEGRGLNAVIRRNDKPVAYVLDEGCGGEIQIDFRNPLYNPKSFKATTQEMAKAEEALFAEFVRAWADTQKREIPTEERIDAYLMQDWVCHQADAIENDKRLARIAKKKVLFRVEGDSIEEWRTLNGGAYSPSAQAWLDKKYGAKVIAIYGVR